MRLTRKYETLATSGLEVMNTFVFGAQISENLGVAVTWYSHQCNFLTSLFHKDAMVSLESSV